MTTKILSREELKQKVMDRTIELIEKYSYSAERGIEEIEKELVIMQMKADNTEVSADERIINIMLETVILTAYAFEIGIIPHLDEKAFYKSDESIT